MDLQPLPNASGANPASSKGMLWAGRIICAVPILFMCSGLIMTLRNPSMMTDGMKHLGYPPEVGRTLLIVEASCMLLYIIPQTAVLGAILLTGYLGGAVASHVRMGESNWWLAVLMGVLVWLGLYLRDGRLRSLLPRLS
jgi:hypothetical protein